jgi:hypothetical protein
MEFVGPKLRKATKYAQLKNVGVAVLRIIRL